MSKKILPAIFLCITFLGIILMLVGFFVLGGRFGVFAPDTQGNMVYHSQGEDIVVGKAASWMSYIPGGIGISSRVIYQTISTPGIHDGLPQQTAPFAGDELNNLNIDIGLSTMYVVSGDDWGISVDGFVPYSANFENGTWSIRTEETIFHNLWRQFWWLFRPDETVFTLVVPSNFEELDITVSAGEVFVSDITLEELNANVNAGSLILDDITAETTSLSADVGNIETKNLQTDVCELSTDVGNIEFQGDISDKLWADSDIGNIIIEMQHPGSYSWNIDSSIGNVSIGHNNMSSFSQTTSGAEGSGGPHFDLSSDIGNVEVIFN